MEEIWKPIENYVGYYDISNLGNVRSLKRLLEDSIGRIYTIKFRILKLGKDTDGYPQVILQKDRLKYSAKVHRLVANAFIPNPYNKQTVNHIDGNKENNNMLNLEWATIKENIQHSYDTGLRFALRGSEHTLSKSIIQYDLNLNYLNTYGSTVEAERLTGINRRTISYCANLKTKKAGGYIWRFN